MVKELQVTIRVFVEPDTGEGNADIDIKGEHNDPMLYALLAQVELTKELVMNRIKQSTRREKGADDGTISFR